MRKYTCIILSLIFGMGPIASCKKKPDLPWVKSKDKPNSENGTGNNQGPSTDPSKPTGELPDKAAEDLFQLVVDGLKAKHQSAENHTWFTSKALIEGDWIAYSPKGYWGKDATNLPKGYDCKSGNTGCDPVFERKLCSADSECADSHTQCQELLASVAKPGELPKKMCLGSGDKVIDDYYSVMVKTEKHLEISSLTLPSGRFRKAMINAFAYLSHKNPETSIRMLLSSTDGITPNILNPSSKIMGQIL